MFANKMVEISKLPLDGILWTCGSKYSLTLVFSCSKCELPTEVQLTLLTGHELKYRIWWPSRGIICVALVASTNSCLGTGRRAR